MNDNLQTIGSILVSLAIIICSSVIVIVSNFTQGAEAFCSPLITAVAIFWFMHNQHVSENNGINNTIKTTSEALNNAK